MDRHKQNPNPNPETENMIVKKERKKYYLIWCRNDGQIKDKLARLSRVMAREKKVHRIMLADAVEIAIDEALNLRGHQ
jgi:DNA-binding transcriptional regulator/RsmH inhibitor MraZ